MKRFVFPVLLIAALLLTGCSASFDANANANVPTISSAAEPLTREQARDLALEQAGVTADQVTRLEVEYDTDDGVARYEVSFHYDGWEYDYEFNADTGELLSYDRDKETR